MYDEPIPQPHDDHDGHNQLLQPCTHAMNSIISDSDSPSSYSGDGTRRHRQSGHVASGRATGSHRSRQPRWKRCRHSSSLTSDPSSMPDAAQAEHAHRSILLPLQLLLAAAARLAPIAPPPNHRTPSRAPVPPCTVPPCRRRAPSLQAAAAAPSRSPSAARALLRRLRTRRRRLRRSTPALAPAPPSRQPRAPPCSKHRRAPRLPRRSRIRSILSPDAR